MRSVTEWGWQGVQQMGWIRRYRKRLGASQWTVAEHTVVTSHRTLTPTDILSHLRAHWHIETRVPSPRDVSWREDRYHGRAIGPMLAELRNLALTLLRQQQPGMFVPDVWSYLSAHPPVALFWLVGKVKE